MKIEALCHIPKSNYAYAYKGNELHIRMRTAKDDLKQVNLIFGNKYEWYQKQQKHSMKKVYSDLYYDYFQYDIVEEDCRIGYYFELVDEIETLYYTEVGMVSEFNNELAYCYFFQYPYINPADVHEQPFWVHDAVFYQIFVERFHNGNPQNSPSNLSKWEDAPGPRSFFGGDLQGIINKLGYLQELGINGIYLTPIFTSPSNHKYDIVNYYEIDPFFGDEKIFRELVDQAHGKGIKIILDAVFNHSSNEFLPFRDVVLNGKESIYFDWFFIDGSSIMTNPPNYRTFGNVGYMPKLNTANPELKKYLLDSVRYWTSKYHIDGWRLDVSDEIDHQFWRDFRTVVKGFNQEAIIIGENWHNALPWLLGDQFDSVMNYPVTKLCLDFFANKKIDAKTFEYQLSTYLMRYPDQVNEAMLNLLDSHDTERFLYSAKGYKASLKNAAAFLFAYKGIPCTFYGTEIGMTGSHDPGCRKGFEWREDNWDMDLYRRYQLLMLLRKNEKALQKGKIEFDSREQLFIMKRIYGQETIVVLINQSQQEQVYEQSLPEGFMAVELLRDEKMNVTNNIITIKISQDDAAYIKIKEK